MNRQSVASPQGSPKPHGAARLARQRARNEKVPLRPGPRLGPGISNGKECQTCEAVATDNHGRAPYEFRPVADDGVNAHHTVDDGVRLFR